MKEAVLDAYYDDSVKEFLSGGWDSSKRIARSRLLNVLTQAVIKLGDNEPFVVKLSDPDFENYFLIIPGCMQFLFNVGFQVSSILTVNVIRKRQILLCFLLPQIDEKSIG